MPRPKHSDPAKTFAAIVDAAVVVLQEQGPNHVSLRRVSEASGLSMGTLTYYFPNRQDLVEACLDVHYQHISAGILEFHAAVTEGPVDAALIRHHVGRLVDIAFADRSFLQLRALVMAEMQQYLMAAGRDRRGGTDEDLITEPLPEDATRLYVSRDHMDNWFECIKSRKLPICDVEIGHRSASVCHLGSLAIRLGRPLRWDPAKEAFIGDVEANARRHYEYRPPWSLPKVA